MINRAIYAPEKYKQSHEYIYIEYNSDTAHAHLFFPFSYRTVCSDLLSTILVRKLCVIFAPIVFERVRCRIRYMEETECN